MKFRVRVLGLRLGLALELVLELELGLRLGSGLRRVSTKKGLPR